MRTIEAKKCGKISFLEISGRGDPIVFLHGLMDEASSWIPFAEKISRKSIALDLPGFGSSREDGEDLDLWARKYHKILQGRRYFLLGHSLGGALASKIADLDPGSCRGLLLLAPAGYCRIPLAQIIGTPLAESLLRHTAPHAIGFAPLVRTIYGNIFSHHHTIDQDLLHRIQKQRFGKIEATRSGVHIIQRLSKEPFSSNRYQGPVFALWGERDHLISPTKARSGLLRVFPNSKTTILPDTGHHPQAERPKEVLDWCLQSIKS